MFKLQTMYFRTQIPISKSSILIDYNSKILSIGSCFAENMADKLDYFKFQNGTNPFGIIFNPLSIENLFRRVCEKHFFQEKDVFFHNERWHSFEVHSDLSNSDREELLETLKSNRNIGTEDFTVNCDEMDNFRATLSLRLSKAVIAKKILARLSKIIVISLL